jgi:o-succinylbenzoate synthase
MKINYRKHTLEFIKPAGTSRSVLLQNDVWYIFIEKDAKIGVGECNPLVGLSYDDRPDFEEKLTNFVEIFNKEQEVNLELLNDFPAIKFGFECALLDLKNGAEKLLFPSEFTEGKQSIHINGLLWMGSKSDMLAQLEEKIALGFSCIKMKIGAIHFDDELAILEAIRAEFDNEKVEIRVDANGAFKVSNALDKLKVLSNYQIHSIEQPIAVGQWEEMKKLVKRSPIAIALDEELIPLRTTQERMNMLRMIQPHYIILKPSLLGGFAETDEWIKLATELNIGWWMTSALESNVGLSAIAQYAFNKGVMLAQGLGTGALYSNNIDSPLYISKGALSYDPSLKWGAL